MRAAALALVVAAALAGSAAAAPVRMPGPSYEVLRSGPPGGAHPGRGDTAVIRYVGRLAAGGEVFSTSTDGGAGTSTFPVRQTIPGFQALLQRMRPGDRWRLTLPGYLAYGAQGRTHVASDATLRRDVPPDATLVFDVELVSFAPTPPG